MSGIHVDRDAFFRRVKCVYGTWKHETNDEMGKVDALVCAVGTDEDVVSSL